MKKTLTVLFALAFLVSCTFSFNVPINSVGVEKKFDINTAYGSIARLFVKAINGPGEISATGFAIDKYRIVTAGHFCIAVLEYQARGLFQEKIGMEYYINGDGKDSKYGLKMVEVDEVHDICLLELSRHGLAPLKFLKNYAANVHPRDLVYIVGAPLGYLGADFQGKVMDALSSGFSEPNLNNKLIVTVAATAGFSGSPILNENGEIIGMLVMGDASYDHFSICTTSDSIQRFLWLIGVNV